MAKKDQPDLFWRPLIALHTGMRISEVTGIYCDDMFKSPDGVDVIPLRKPKTGAGIRDALIAKALIDLGFLKFVAQQQTVGDLRLFPDRLLINSSYSKELSDAFRDHLIAVGARKAVFSWHSHTVKTRHPSAIRARPIAAA